MALSLPGDAAGRKALADYKRELGVLACDGSPLASELDVDAGRVEGEAAFLETVSELPEPVLYGSARQMPLLAYLGYVSDVVPAIAWAIPVLALSAALVRLRTNGSLVHAAEALTLLEYGHIVAHDGEVIRARDAGWAAADAIAIRM